MHTSETPLSAADLIDEINQTMDRALKNIDPRIPPETVEAVIKAAAPALIKAGSAWQRERWIALIRDLLEPREFPRVGAATPCKEQDCRHDRSNNPRESHANTSRV